MPQSECRNLFAYGTLMTTAVGVLGRAQRARLMREAKSLGPASVRGRLFDLGSYPGLVEPHGDGEIVYGELLELIDPARSLVWLDAYEGIVPGDHPHNAYRRLQYDVRLASGERRAAWIYLYQGALTRARLISEGRWSGN